MVRIIQLMAVCALTPSLLCHAGTTPTGKPAEATTVERPATVLLITAESLMEAWKPFAAWKTRLGKATRIVTVETIAKEYKGKDIQEKIRACVQKHAATKGTRWVILGGDSEPDGKGLVPDRDTPHVLWGRQRVSDIPTDLYYISEKNWDANADGVYGDWKTDLKEVQYTGKACIGRIPVRTAGDVKAYTDKVIAYESRYPERDLATRFLYTCSVPQANYKADMYWDRYLSPEWKAGKCSRFFVNKTPWDKASPGDYDLNAEHWLERINGKQVGKMHMHGHGFLPCWVLEKRSLVTAKTIAQLKNEDAYLVMTTVSCFTGQYDSTKDPCITESMLRQPKAGAVIVLAPSRPGVPVFHNWARDPKDGKTQDGTTRTLTRFWVNGLSKNLTAGEAFALAKADLEADARKSPGYHWDQCEINLLGDPTLDLRAADPTTPKVKASLTVPVGRREITVECGEVGLTVCLWKGDEVYAVGKTGEEGKAMFAVHPRTAGKMLLTVTGPSKNAYLGGVEVK